MNEKIKNLLNLVQEICADIREKYASDDVCGLCEYDGAYQTESNMSFMYSNRLFF